MPHFLQGYVWGSPNMRTGDISLLPLYIVSGYTDGDACAGGGLYAVNFNREVTFTAPATGISFRNERTSGSATGVSSLTATGATTVEYTVTWDAADEPIIGDIISFLYVAAAGDYVDSDGVELLTQVTAITNCLSVTALGTYITGSIYDATKSVTVAWQYEKLASGVNTVWSREGDIAVEIGMGATPELAQSGDVTIAIAASVLTNTVTADEYIAWRSDNGVATGTFDLEQSVSI